jgi:uncharacterized protein (TIGR03083 family)
MKPVEPILIVDLFPEERQQFLDLLTRLPDKEWSQPTVCTGWSVKDVALHLLGDDIGLLSRTPDFKFPPIEGIDSWESLVAFINHNNELWVQATRRINSLLLCDFLEITGQKVYQRLTSLDLFALGVPVDWAGPDPAPIWLDVAREYTERWMHQQHIRDAVGQPGLKDRQFFGPVLDAFVRALPHTFRKVGANPGTSIKLLISGEAGGEWFLVRGETGWGLYLDQTSEPETIVTMDQETAWRLFTKGLSPEEAEKRTTIAGDRPLGLPVLDTVSIIA